MITEKITLSGIKNLIQKKEYTTAYRQIELYIHENPKDANGVALYRKIKKLVYKENLEKVKLSIEKIDFMWKQKRYKELLELYIKLHPYAPSYTYLNKLTNKAYNAYLKTEQTKQENNISKILNVVNGYIDTKNYSSALDLIEKAIKEDSKNPIYQKLLIDTKRKIIDSKIDDNKSVFRNTSAPELYDFVKKLYTLEPTYFKAQKLLAKYHVLLQKHYDNQKVVFNKDAKRQIKILYNENNLEKSMQAAKELLRVDPKNSFALKYYYKALKKTEEENFNIAYDKLTKQNAT